jgi:predicted outer membrane protein
MEISMKIWRLRILISALCAGPAAGSLAVAGCDRNPQEATPPSCKFPTACLVTDAAPPQIDGTKPIPVQDCIAASARAILTTEQRVGMLGQTSATDPTVKAIATQMTADFTAALADLDAISPGLGINKMFDCSDKEQAAGLVQPALAQLQTLSGAAFDAQFVSLEAAALQQVLDFYNEELIANANSGAFKTSLRYERWRIAGDGGTAVTTLFPADASCPSPAVAPSGARPTCLGVIAEMTAVQALSGAGSGATDGGGATDAGETDMGAADAGGG